MKKKYFESMIATINNDMEKSRGQQVEKAVLRAYLLTTGMTNGMKDNQVETLNVLHSQILKRLGELENGIHESN